MKEEQSLSKRETEEDLQYKVMTFGEYAEKEHETPYVFEITYGDKKIVYFGARHSHKPDGPMFEQIRKRFEEANPQVVFVEGMTNLKGREEEASSRAKEVSEQEVIKKFGEPGFTLKLAAESGVKFESPEPNAKEKIQHLVEQGFSQEELFAYFMYDLVLQYHRMIEKPSIEEYLKPHIESFQRDTNWQNFDYSVDNLKNIGEKIWGKRGDLSKNDDSRTNPVPWKSKRKKWTNVNKISQQDSIIRDKFIIQRIIEAMKNNDRVFVVYGASHAVMQEPALRKVFE